MASMEQRRSSIPPGLRKLSLAVVVITFVAFGFVSVFWWEGEKISGWIKLATLLPLAITQLTLVYFRSKGKY